MRGEGGGVFVVVVTMCQRTLCQLELMVTNDGGAVVGAASSGGLAVSLRVGSTSLCFVSCHLAAHEGEKYLKRRHENVHEIINVRGGRARIGSGRGYGSLCVVDL